MPQRDNLPDGTDPSPVMVPPTAARDARARGRGVLVLVLVLVNGAAIWGQTGYALDHVVPAQILAFGVLYALALALAVSAALELIGVFLASMADQAEEKGIAAGGYRLGSYAVGLFSGVLNFSHFSGIGLPAACLFALLSTASPFLWGIYATVKRGRPVAPSRRFWHPIRSIELIRFAAWEGIADENDAIVQMAFRDAESVVPVSPAPAGSRIDLGHRAFRMKDEQPDRSWESIAGELRVSASHLFKCRTAALEADMDRNGS